MLRENHHPRLSRMRALRRRLCRPRSGQTLVVFALVSLVVIGALGLVLDSGYDYAQRRHMQNVADAAALAGARALATNNEPGFGVWSTVQNVAQQNGVQSSQIVNCEYLDDIPKSLNPALTCQAQNDAPFAAGTDVTAVRVTLQEQHQTFVMRALGIASSGSAATAVAQVQLLTKLPNALAPFLPCGVNTQMVDSSGSPVSTGGPNNDGFMSILVSSGTYTFPSGVYAASAQYPDPTYKGSPPSTTTVNGRVKIDDNAWSYDAAPGTNHNMPPSAPGLTSTAPNPNAFLLHAPGGAGENNGNGQASIVRCTADSYSSWHGYNGAVTGDIDINQTLPMQGAFDYGDPNNWNPTYPGAVSPTSNDQGYISGLGGLTYAGTGDRAGPASGVPGAGGCQPNQESNCILLLPIEDNSIGSNSGSNGILAARTYAAFYMMSSPNGNSHWGYLIRNYSVTLPSSPEWRPGATGITTIHLVK
ncbi:MAG TPA: pilus assembly protein TadG-related protein [Thermomicrobiales bacterium]|nr:pilus assembly protein TadG-related protein [Thermomicrobiales bacterium]